MGVVSATPFLTSEAPPEVPPPAGPCVVVILGAAGDLTKRLLLPAIYNLSQQKLLPEEFAVLGFERTDMDDQGFRSHIAKNLWDFACDGGTPGGVDWITSRLYYLPVMFDDPTGYEKVRDRLHEIDQKHGTKGNYLFYLATAPQFFLEAARQLKQAGLLSEEQGVWRRLVIEKPFGRDVNSAKELNRSLLESLHEEQIYRIDHYLGKETVQNILAFRFGNGIFEPIWNRRYVDHVQITAAETVGVELRGGYYDKAGALRDMVPNHLMQLVSLTAMEPPVSFHANAVRNEQVKVLEAIHPVGAAEVDQRAVRGQYDEGTLDGQGVAGYRVEPHVDPHSNTETYAAAKLLVDNWRWADVPFYIRTGKRLSKRNTEVSIHFRRAPMQLFRKTGVQELGSNVLVMHIQPSEGLGLRFDMKVPGPLMQLGHVEMRFAYSDFFGRSCRTGYETLLYDCMLGDPTLFQRADMIEEGWNIIKEVQGVWADTPPKFPTYPAGSEGPAAANELLARDGRKWRSIG
jgi:glucose-6-phosphate 1-dehydrogenase